MKNFLISSFSIFTRGFFFFVGLMGGLFFFLLLSTLFLTKILPDGSCSVEFLGDADGNSTAYTKNMPLILQIDIEGIIGLGETTGRSVKRSLEWSRKKFQNDNIKAILLRVNSPGGSVVDSNAIYKSIKDYKDRYMLPIHVYVDGISASGGYYISCVGDQISSSTVSIVGSVGVRSSPMFNVYRLTEKLGIEAKTITAGKHKLKYDPFAKEINPEDYQDLVNIIDYQYKHFVSLVSEARSPFGLTAELLQNEYGANVFASADALSKGYIDEISDYRDSLKKLANIANLSESPYQVISIVPNKSGLQGAFENQLNYFCNKLLKEFWQFL